MEELKTMNLSGIFAKTFTDDDTIQWLKSLGLLKKEQNCSSCNVPMCWSSSLGTIDKYEWRCNQILCRNECSIRTGSFFANSNLRLMDIMQFIYMWSYNMAFIENCKWELKFEPESVYYWKGLLRNVCFESAVLRNANVIGGKGHVIRIDKSLLSKTQYKIGVDYLQVWIFGGINIKTNEIFLVPIKNKDTESLISVIKQYVRPGSIILSDLWGENSCLNEFGYIHITIDLDTGDKKTALESLWSKIKWRNRFQYVNSDDLLGTFFIEYLWRQKFGQKPFFNIIDQIRKLYTLNTSDIKLLPAIMLVNGTEVLEIHCNGPSFYTNNEDYSKFLDIKNPSNSNQYFEIKRISSNNKQNMESKSSKPINEVKKKTNANISSKSTQSQKKRKKTRSRRKRKIPRLSE